MLRGMGRFFWRGRRRSGRKPHKISIHTTDLLGGGVSGWREHGREDSPSCAACTLPDRVGVAVGGYVFCGCRRVASMTVALALRLAFLCRGLVGGNRGQGRSYKYRFLAGCWLI